ncbi:MAG: hypothetical protein ACYDCK_10725 [Thermoplasmatota archaeon]
MAGRLHGSLLFAALALVALTAQFAGAVTAGSNDIEWRIVRAGHAPVSGTGALPGDFPFGDIHQPTVPPLTLNFQPPGVLAGSVEHMYVSRSTTGQFLYHRASLAPTVDPSMEAVNAHGYAQGFHRCAEPAPEPCPGTSGELDNWVSDHEIALYGNVSTYEARVPNGDGTWTIVGFASTFGALIADGLGIPAMVS